MPNRDLLLRNGHVFDVESRSFAANTDVLIQNGRIAAVGVGLAAPEDIRIADGTGKYVLPGLIDCHVHLTSSGDPDALVRAQAEPAHLRALRAANHARATLEAGFTLVRDLGAPEHLNVHLARAIAEGIVSGPTILAAGMGVTMTGGHGHGFIAREADGPDEVRKAVREQLRAGATAIKLFASGGVMTQGVNPQSPSLTVDELRAGVEEAHKAFRIVGAHAQAAQGIRNAVEAGVDSIEHGVWLDEATIALMVERGTCMVPTLTAPHHIAHGGLEAGIAPYMVEKGWQVLDAHLASFRAALKAGVRVAMGTDQGTPLNRPGENAQEIVRMAEHGLGPAGAILAATKWAAELLQASNDYGSLSAGKYGDLLILNSDPLTDITALTRVEHRAAVFKDGKLVMTQPGFMKEGYE